ncbi:MAG TPA: TIGR03619 family F420-dependent LLM class oxidoreductase [Candidatus Cybelea sp.]|nr:TIGR03619 family F420-dependent LLM class oxidoreductase [Candidatus Cybelea sp.]
MLLGFDTPTRGSLATPENITRIVTEGEALGFGYCTLSDHIVIPSDISARYPYSDTGEFPAGGRGDWYEQLTSAAFVAAKTSRLRFVTSVMVVPHRPAVLTAKILSTIDLLSGGRLTVGCGAGWLKEEFEAVGAEAFAERGDVTNEYLQAFKELWTSPKPHFNGRYVQFSNVNFEPKPAQKPHPPLWIGGESEPALRRAARLGDGWYPIGVNPAHPLDTFSRYKASVDRVRQKLAEAGRDPSKFSLAYRCPRHGKGVEPRTSDGERRLFSGEARDIADDIRALADLGVGSIDFAFGAQTVDATLGNMKRFGDEVMARI